MEMKCFACRGIFLRTFSACGFCGRPTSASGLQLLLHEFFGGGKLTVLHFGHDVILTDCTDHLRLFLVAVLGLNMDPWDFPNRENIKRALSSPPATEEAYRSQLDPRPLALFFFFFIQANAPFKLVDEERR